MKLTLGEKIKELRRRDGRKQEDLADALGVTNQAVSRWENDSSYPDMELIPAIANYFGISIDELFGYENDREKKIKYINEKASEILTNEGFTVYQGSLSDEVIKCIDMLRSASKEFPSEPTILLKLSQALVMWGWNIYGAKARFSNSSDILEEDIEHNSQNIYWQEAICILEKLLKVNPPYEIREIAIRQMVPLYCRLGELEKSKKLAEAQNSIVISKELLLPLATTGQEKQRYLAERILVLVSNLRFSLSESVALRPSLSSSHYGKDILLSVINLYETIFIDGKCGTYHWDIGSLYLTLVRYEINNNGTIEDILDLFDKGFNHCIEYNRIIQSKEYEYTSPLVNTLNKSISESHALLGDDFWKKELNTYPQTIVEEIRKVLKYSECFK